MTGQVKEEILTRFGELGVLVRAGQLGFSPALLRPSEFLDEPSQFDYYDVAGVGVSLDLEAGMLAFTICQVPILYKLSPEPGIELFLADGTGRTLDGLALDQATSREIFERSGSVVRVEVSLIPGLES